MNEKPIQGILKEIIVLMKEKYPDFQGIYFFGSRSRGDYSKDSDYDICLVFSRKIDWKFESDVIDLICKFMIEYDIVLDTKIYNIRDIQNPITPLRENIKNEGIYYAG